MKRYLAVLSVLIVLLLGGVGAAAALQQDSSSPRNEQKSPTTSNSKGQTQEAAGEEVFQANCARCHMPPMSIPQRVTGTIIMHMRVRARLSRQDEQLLLKYMAP
jgi:cytochrome c5